MEAVASWFGAYVLDGSQVVAAFPAPGSRQRYDLASVSEGRGRLLPRKLRSSANSRNRN